MSNINKRLNKLASIPNAQALLMLKQWAESIDLNTYQPINETAVTNSAFVAGNEVIMMGAYNYSGLNNDPRINKAAIDAINKYGTGTCGVWLLTGYIKLHKELEEKIAEFIDRKYCLVFNSGFNTNYNFIASLYGGTGSEERDVILFDHYAHRSLQEGIRFASGNGAKMLKFKHNDMEDLKHHLEENKNFPRKIIVVDSVYSMHGDITPITEIIKLADEYDANIFVDEAHATGVIGKTGRGIQEYANLQNHEIDIVMGTLSKSIPGNGGFIATDDINTIEYLQYNSPYRVFTASMTPANTAAALEAIKILSAEGEEIVARLKERIDLYIDGMLSNGFNLLDSPKFRTAVIPVLVGDQETTLRFAKEARDAGIIIPPILSPAVPKNQCLLRSCVQAGHTKEQLRKVIDVLARIGKKLKVI